MVAFDPAGGAVNQTLKRACDTGTAFDGTHLYQIVESCIDKVDPGHRRGADVHSSTRKGRRRGNLRWAD
ncbi:MAG: hypothetical protein M3Y32_11785, partial [Pseudomonadota bacterium]|nr:hypothetical protein [Pseudomonadota bacterium]